MTALARGSERAEAAIWAHSRRKAASCSRLAIGWSVGRFSIRDTFATAAGRRLSCIRKGSQPRDVAERGSRVELGFNVVEGFNRRGSYRGLAKVVEGTREEGRQNVSRLI